MKTGRETKKRLVHSLLCVGLLTGTAVVQPGAVDAQERDASDWVLPRTPDGHPDLQGNWTNATLTTIQRQGDGPLILSPDAVAAAEGRRSDFIEEHSQDSDPDREAPPAGGVAYGDPLFDAASGGTGGYNLFWIDAGDRVAVYNGEPRSSLITFPENGRIPELTAAGQQRVADRRAFAAQFGQYDNPENRPLAERCIVSFGSNAGPPMLPNYFYNNNYTIVQTADHVMIMTEMVHDVRVIQLGDRRPLPDEVRPWFGDSWGWWEDDTLVVETTNFSAEQLRSYANIVPGAGDNLKIIERFSRADEFTINYEFTVVDPDTYASEWGGQVPFVRMGDLLYEYACHEGNYALSNVLSGARAQERDEANRNQEN